MGVVIVLPVVRIERYDEEPPLSPRQPRRSKERRLPMPINPDKVVLTTAQVTFLRMVVAFFTKLGWSVYAACGIAANIFFECSFNPKEVGDNGHAIGICQWQGPRRADFLRIFKVAMTPNTSVELQLQFVQWELTKGAKLERKAGALLKEAKSPAEAGSIFSLHYERPAGKEREAAARGKLAQKFYDQYFAIKKAPPPAAA